MAKSLMAKNRVLEGIPPLHWGNSEETSGIASLTRLMNYIGVETDYTELMGLSGAAFHISFYMDQWCPGCPAMYDLDRAVEPFGYEIDTLTREMYSYDIRAHRQIIDAINHGVPVLAVDLLKESDWGLIVGYNPDYYLMRTYYDPEDGYSIARYIPWVLKFVNKKSPPISKCETAIRALRHATDRFSTKIINETYANGPFAYRKWQEMLADDEWFENCSEVELLQAWHANAWIYNNLYDARVRAIEYPHRIATQFPEEVSKYLDNATEIYHRQVGDLYHNWHYAPFPSWVNQEQSRIEFPNGFEPRWVEGTNWTDEMREFQRPVLSRVKLLDIEAMNQIELFLKNVCDDCSVDC